jgi:S1-C subfamily serine protease
MFLLLTGCQLGGDIVHELGEFGRRYKYGPYYAENQELKRKEALADLEEKKARKEYWEHLKNIEAKARLEEEGGRVGASAEIKESPETSTEQPVVARGTGFLFARRGLVATNYHVISDGKRINIYFPKAELEFDATIELKDINSDLAILKIKDFEYNKIFSQEVPFAVKRASGVQLGEEVFTLGFPLGELLGKSAKFSDGTISSLSGLLGSANLFQINNPIQPGNSGGPLFDSDGNIVGIVLATLDAKFFYENLDTIPQNVNFAIKSDYLISLISMLPEGPSILSRKGSLKNKTQAEQISSLVPFVVTVSVR